MSTPVENVTEAVEEHLLGWDPQTARKLANGMYHYASLFEKLRLALHGLSERVQENRAVQGTLAEDLEEMARTLRTLYGQADEAHTKFYKDNQFWFDDEDGE